MALPIRVAIACPEREAELWAMVEDPEFRVDGRTCAFAGPCASVAELREALASGAADVVLVSATVNAIPFETLRGLAEARRMVVLAPDESAERWQQFESPVLGLDPDRGESWPKQSRMHSHAVDEHDKQAVSRGQRRPTGVRQHRTAW